MLRRGTDLGFRMSAWLAKALVLLSWGPAGYGDELFYGALRTIEISVLAYFLGLTIGALGATGKLYGPKWLKELLHGYTTLVRAVPELVLLLLLYYAGTDVVNTMLGGFGKGPIEVNGLAAAVGVLGFVQGAYSTEVIRAAILAIPHGQMEAARAFGMGGPLMARRIILPAMLPFAMPGLANLWLIVTKDSALVSVVGGIAELSLVTKQAAGVTKQYLLLYLVTAFIYLAITLFSNRIFNWLENMTRRGQRKLT